jgi:cytidyltransferase-like protein
MKQKFGIFVGRFSPLHLGHEAVINHMIEECGLDGCMVILGSSNNQMSFRHLFSYEERRSFLEKIFPGLKIIGLPDYSSDHEWLLALNDILSFGGVDVDQAVFFGGCEEDIYFFLEYGKKCQLMNRFNGETPKISATEVRDALIQGRTLSGLVNPLVEEDVKNSFLLRWEEFRKK